MDRRAFLQAVVGGAAAYTLLGCSRTDSPSGADLVDAPVRLLPPSELPPAPRPTLRLPGGEMGVLTPFAYNLPPVYFTMAYVYDSLLWTDSTGALIPWLATQMPERSPDGLTYSFELRDDVRWQDGRPLTVADVVFTFEYFAAHRADLSPLLLFVPENVRSVRSTGARTVEVVLDKPVVTFLESVAGRVPIIPRHIWSAVPEPGVTDDALVLGSGPYRLGSHDATEGSYLFTANDEFFLGPPFVKRLELRPVGDTLQALLAGDIDAASLDQPTATVRDRFRRDPDFGIAKGPPDLFFALSWNLDRGGALADPRFRRACAHAIDRKDLARRLTGGQGEPGNPGFLPLGHPFRVEVEQYRFDPALAAGLLEQAGYRKEGKFRVGPNGKRLRIKLTTPAAATVAQPVADALRQVGIDIQIDPVDILFGADYDMAIVIFGGHQGDPDLMRRVYSSKSGPMLAKARGYADPEFDELAERQLVTLDEEERKALVARMQHIVAKDLPLLHLYYPAPSVVYRRTVFDQVAVHRNGIGPLNKQALVTGVATGGAVIRPTA